MKASGKGYVLLLDGRASQSVRPPDKGTIPVRLRGPARSWSERLYAGACGLLALGLLALALLAAGCEGCVDSPVLGVGCASSSGGGFEDDAAQAGQETETRDPFGGADRWIE